MRLIDADALCDDLNTVNPKYKTMIDWCIRVIKAQPTVDAEPVIHGHWIVKEDVFGEGEARVAFFAYATCSVCGDIFYDVNTIGHKPIWDYCPSCGAKMDEEYEVTE